MYWSSVSVLLSVLLLIEQRNVMRKQRNWERQLAAKKSKRKEEKQRRKLSREQESGKYQMKRILFPIYGFEE